MHSLPIPSIILLLISLATSIHCLAVAAPSGLAPPESKTLSARGSTSSASATCSYFLDTSSKDASKHHTKWAIVAPNAAGDLDPGIVGLNLKLAIDNTDCDPQGKHQNTWQVHVDQAQTGFIVTWNSQTECGKQNVEDAAKLDSIMDQKGGELICHEVEKEAQQSKITSMITDAAKAARNWATSKALSLLADFIMAL